MVIPAATLQQALAHHQQGQLAQAEALYREVLQIQPRHFDALHLLGVAVLQRGEAAAALELIDGALAVRASSAGAHSNRGLALQALGRPAEALASYDRALALQPEYPEALCNRGNALQDLGRYTEALASYDRALALQPEQAEALNDRGNALQVLRRYEEALASYDRALALRPEHAGALANRGHTLQDLARFEGSMASYARALAVKPDLPFVFGCWLYSKMKLCDWTGLDEAFARLGADIDAGLPVASPFDAMATPLCRDQQRRCAELYAQHKHPPVTTEPVRARTARGDRIRLGYFSADLHNHPVAVLMAGVLERHDRSRFELIAFSLGTPVLDEMRARIASACDQFIDVHDRTDADVALRARALEVDIAVDLMGFTRDSRTGIFARRAGPVQVNYLGFPGTMGAPYMDYLIADETVIPAENAGGYTEQVVYLPHSFQPNDATRLVADRQFSRAELGLPERGFVFCNFNNCYKITPEDFDGWMRLLQQVPGSVLWLAGAHPVAERNLRREAGARGVAPERLVFKARTPELPDHLAELRQADLFLDCAYFNAHTTASDALWAGVPLVTRPGETYVSRVAASLLTALGLPELIAASAPDYEALALALATDPPRLAALRKRLAANRRTEPLFDTAGYTRHLEAAYRLMWQRHRAGLPPAAFRVPV